MRDRDLKVAHVTVFNVNLGTVISVQSPEALNTSSDQGRKLRMRNRDLLVAHVSYAHVSGVNVACSEL